MLTIFVALIIGFIEEGVYHKRYRRGTSRRKGTWGSRGR